MTTNLVSRVATSVVQLHRLLLTLKCTTCIRFSPLLTAGTPQRYKLDANNEVIVLPPFAPTSLIFMHAAAVRRGFLLRSED